MNLNLKRNRGVCALLLENRNTTDKYPKQFSMAVMAEGLILNMGQLSGLAAEKLLVLRGHQ